MARLGLGSTFRKVRASRFASGANAVQQADRARDARDWSAAALHYKQALRVAPHRSEIWVQYGHALKESGNVLEALKAYEKALALDGTSSDTHLQIGHALKLQGRNSAALEAYAKAAELSPGSREAAREFAALAKLENDASEPGEARESTFGNVTTPGWWSRYTGKSVPSTLGSNTYGSLTQVLVENRLLAPFVGGFDPEFYTHYKKLSTSSVDWEIKAFVHFCEVGIFDCTPINDLSDFEPDFYAATYRIGFPMSASDCYRRWLNAGYSKGEAPNMKSWLSQHGLELSTLAELDLDAYRMGNVDLQNLPLHEVIERWIFGGVVEDRHLIMPTESNVYIFDAVSSRAASLGEQSLAQKIDELVLSVFPDRISTARQYAERLYRGGRPFLAANFLERVIERGGCDRSVHRLLSECKRAQGHYRSAYEAACEGVRRFPQYPSLRRARLRALDDYYQSTSRAYEGLALTQRISEGQRVVEEYCETVAGCAEGNALAPKPIRSVAIFASLMLPQCRHYRVDQKVEQLTLAGYDVEVFDFAIDLERFLSDIRKFDAVIFYRVVPLPDVLPALWVARELGLTTFFELDDLLFLSEAFPGSFESYSGGLSKTTHSLLSKDVPLFAGAMSMCDYGIASTPTLAREMEKFVRNGVVFVHRNGLSLSQMGYFDDPPRPVGETVTIFYGSGTLSNKADFYDLVEPALIHVARKYRSKVRIVLVGWLEPSEALYAAAENLTVMEPSFDTDRYWAILKEADINIAVLRPSLNTNCKSEIKWLEAAVFGVPSIVSRTETYSDVVEHGETGLICDTVAEWKDALDRLVADPDLRGLMGRKAREAAMSGYNPKTLSRNLVAIFESATPDRVVRKKVLLVNVFYAPQKYGGATRVICDNVDYIKEHYGDEIELEVFSVLEDAPVDYVTESYAESGVRVTVVSRSAAGEGNHTIRDKKIGEIFRSHLKTINPDLVHFHCIQRLTVSVVDAARELHIPYFITAHDGWWVSDNQFLIGEDGRESLYNYGNPLDVLSRMGPESFGRMQALRSALFGAKYVLGVSRTQTQLYADCGVPNTRTVANGVSYLHALPRRPSGDGRVRLGHVGGLLPYKGYTLLKAVLMSQEFARLRLVVVDQSKDKDWRRDEMWGSTPVTIRGRSPQSEMAELYSEIDVLIAPSICRESFGLAPREALACGCWVVASDRGAMGDEVVEGENGHRIDVSDSAGLRRVLETIDANPSPYGASPATRPVLRTSDEQGEDLAKLYLAQAFRSSEGAIGEGLDHGIPEASPRGLTSPTGAPIW